MDNSVKQVIGGRREALKRISQFSMNNNIQEDNNTDATSKSKGISSLGLIFLQSITLDWLL